MRIDLPANGEKVTPVHKPTVCGYTHTAMSLRRNALSAGHEEKRSRDFKSATEKQKTEKKHRGFLKFDFFQINEQFRTYLPSGALLGLLAGFFF